ncbi:MAG: Transcriptional regulator [Chthonomonadaceae bacterium]|nr:Transcriptional regulator [Chthonomonadaceae bacterium]
MPNNKDKQTKSALDLSGKPEGVGRHSDTAMAEPEPPLEHALFRVMRALVFDDRPVPELDGLPLAQLRLLMSVYYGPNSTMKDFSERLNVSQSTVTQLAERLVKRGLVDRMMDAHDRRVIRLHTSVRGQSLVGQADAARKATLRKVWFALAPSEQRRLEKALTLLGECGEKIRAEEGRPVPPLPDAFSGQNDHRATHEDPQTKPVDLMTRRIRGR